MGMFAGGIYNPFFESPFKGRKERTTSLKGIDISNWQAGIDVSAVPSDFVIVKATQGAGYVSPDFKRQVDQAISAGKLVGIYHYIDGAGVEREMDHFISKWSAYKGRAIPVLDWESIQNSAWQDEGYLERCIKHFVSRAQVPPIVYASLSVFPWDVCSRNNCGTWVAQYADMNPTGYQENPWNEGAYSCVIRQYSSTGRLSGWNGNLDINKAYITAEQWKLYANPGTIVEGTPDPSGDKSVSALADEVMAGVWGNGQERVDRLTSAGYDANAVQAEVNRRYSEKTVSQLADEVLAGMHGDGDDRKASLGSRYDEVQAEVNRRLQANDINDLARRTYRGEFGNGDRRRQKLGPLYDAVQKRVNELYG